MAIQFTREDADRLAHVEALLEALHEGLPDQLELSASIGASKAIETVNTRIVVLEKKAAEHDSSIGWLKKTLVGSFVMLFTGIIGLVAGVFRIK